MPDANGRRSPRKDRETAIRLIADLMAANPGVAFKPSEVSTRLGLGRERTYGLLVLMVEDGMIGQDSAKRFRAIGPGESRPRPSDVRAWLAAGRELFGCPVRVTLEVP